MRAETYASQNSTPIRTQLGGKPQMRDILNHRRGRRSYDIGPEKTPTDKDARSADAERVLSHSFAEELGAVNRQLAAALERQCTVSDVLQDVLDSTGIITIFLDPDLRIRTFNPAATELFSISASDLGRSLADVSGRIDDPLLIDEAALVLRSGIARENEIRALDGTWFLRRILPYRNGDGNMEGIALTFVDITARHRAIASLDAARQLADANYSKSRSLAAASHDLRQPLQALCLLRGMMANKLEGEGMSELMRHFDDTLTAMAQQLDTLLDISQLEAWVRPVDLCDFPVADLVDELQTEFGFRAKERGLACRVLPCHARVRSDPQLLEQILRSFLSNAIQYTEKGTVLLGCRRCGDHLRIEIHDTGPGIPPAQLEVIFDAFHPIDDVGRDRDLGSERGLTVVRRLADLLGHRIETASTLGRGSVFAIEIPLASAQTPQESSGTILIVEDAESLAESFKRLFVGEGYRVVTAASEADAQELVSHGGFVPDLMIADYNLLRSPNGLAVIERVRLTSGIQIPAIVLTGDVSTETVQSIAGARHLHLRKPVCADELLAHVRALLAVASPASVSHAIAADAADAADPDATTIFVVDDDPSIRAAMRGFLGGQGWTVEIFASCEAFLEAYRRPRLGCLVLDERMPGMSGVELLRQLRKAGDSLPVVMVTGHGDTRIAVRAMKAGATDFIEKPVGRDDLVASLTRAVDQASSDSSRQAQQERITSRIASLSLRERDIMDRVLNGHPSKNIAADLNVSQRTVENHRAAIMKKLGARSLPEFIRLALIAGRPS